MMKDVIVIISNIGETDQGHKYPYTKVYRYDFDGDDEELIKHIEQHNNIIEGGQMCND